MCQYSNTCKNHIAYETTKDLPFVKNTLRMEAVYVVVFISQGY